MSFSSKKFYESNLEVIDNNGRSYTKNWVDRVEIQLQDDGKTLRIKMSLEKKQVYCLDLSQILDKTARTSLWCFSGTHHTPMGVMKLSWLSLLTFLIERSRDSSQMRQKGGKRKPTQDL